MALIVVRGVVSKKYTKGDANVLSLGGMELIGGWINLNLIHGFEDTGKEYLRNTMIYQEELFKKQVVELHHIYLVQRDLMKNIGITVPAVINQYAPSGTEQSRAGVKITLGIGWDGWENRGDRSDYSENCVELGSMGDVGSTPLTSLAVPSCSKDNQDSPDCVLSMHSFANSPIMHLPYGDTTSSPDETLYRGLKHDRDDLHLNDEKTNTATSFYERRELDLNQYPCDESFSQCNDLAMDDSARFNLASPSHRLVGELQFGLSPCSNNWSEQGAKVSQTSQVRQDADSTYTESEGKSSRQSDQISIVHVHHTESTDTASVSGMLPGIHRNSDSHPRNHNFMITPVPLKETCVGCVTISRDVVIQGSSSLIVKDDVENSNVSFQGNTDEEIESNKCMSSMKDCSVEEFSGSKIVQVGNGLDWSKVSPQRMCHDNDSSTGTDSSLELDSEPCSINDAKAQPLHKTNEKPPEFDSSVQRDAVALVYFLVNGFSKDWDAVEEIDRTRKLKKERPQYSSDLFESIVLKLPESNVDDYSVTSKLYELDDTSTRDFGIKLRRGSRRIKDFRKDVLPHLPSLSSSEIWEDMKIMQDALRSREYKRQRSKAQNAQSGSIPLKSKRPRCNRVARRRNT